MAALRLVEKGSVRGITGPVFVRRFLASLPYVFFCGGSALVGLVGLYALGAVFMLSLLGPGLLLLPGSLRRLRGYADAHRRRAGALLGVEITSDYRPAEGDGLMPVQTMLTDRATYTDLVWLLAHSLSGLLTCALTLGLGVGALSWVTTPLWWRAVPEPPSIAVWEISTWPAALAAVCVGLTYAVLTGLVAPLCARGHARMTRFLLAPRPRKVPLARRVAELTTSRADALDAHAAELRRIERDLHDGAQAGLVSVSLRLGLMKRMLAGNTERLPEMIDRTQELTEQALSQLRQSVRAIYPPILMDRGLVEAVRSLVAVCQVPTELDVETAPSTGRAPVAVESAAYFVISEALTNVAKHSGASAARVRLHITDIRIFISVWDNGTGGVSEESGSGVRGIRRRVGAFDGTTRLTSPDLGPTLIEVELPCGS